VLLIRVLGLLVAVALAGCVLMYFTTSERRYLRYAWLVFKYALFLLVLVLLLLFGERLLAVAGPLGAGAGIPVPA
jgi:cell division protein FtsW (lipid II flippase)